MQVQDHSPASRLPWSSQWCSKMGWLKWHNHSRGPPLRVCEGYNILLLGLPSIIDEHFQGRLHDIFRACVSASLGRVHPCDSAAVHVSDHRQTFTINVHYTSQRSDRCHVLFALYRFALWIERL
ncbi:hypothetical protein AcW1_003542 [Taiwanofungus camphoratus]|nr:hypothetical protein AcW1_003542 [Antrodia cinnamomea]